MSKFLVKVNFNGDMRRFSVPMNSNYDSLLSILSQIYQILPENIFLKYKDNEGDLVSLSSSEELKEAFNVAENMKSKILYLNLQPNNKIQGGEKSNEPLQTLSEEFNDVLKNFSRLTLQENKEPDTMDADDGDEEIKELEMRIARLVFNRVNNKAIQNCPKKVNYVYNLDSGNSNERASEKDRIRAFKKLTYNPNAPPPTPVEPAPVVQQPLKKKIVVLRKSCKACGEPMENKNGRDVCTSLKCAYS